MRRRVLLCEGPEDRAALREIVTRLHGFRRSSTPSAERRESFEKADVALDLIVAGDRIRVATDGADLARYDSPSSPLERLGLSFDPNGQGETQWRGWLEPWHSPAPAFYGLPESQCLERVAVALLSAAHPAEHGVVQRWVDERRSAGAAVSWKMAARLWNALVLPEVAGPGFYSQVFGQHAPTRARVAEALESALPGTALRSFLD